MIRFRKKAVLFCFFVLFKLSEGENDTSNVMKIQSRPRSILTYNNSKQDQKNITKEVVDSYIIYHLQIVLDAVMKLNFSQCGQDAIRVLEAINKRERWALQMFDASSKFPVGLLKGEFYQFGNFDECVYLQQPSRSEDHVPIQGQYCLADVELFSKRQYDGRVARSFESIKMKPRHYFNSTMYWGICVPSSCTTDEVKVVIKELFSMATDKVITVRLNNDRCHINKSQPITTLEIVYGCIMGFFLVFTVLVTVFHWYTIHKKEKSKMDVEGPKEVTDSFAKSALLSFSLITTVSKFLQTKSSDLNLECLQGIKFLSMFTIVAGHSLLFLVGGPVLNTDFFERESQQLPNAIFTNNPLIVDTFLLLSGFLMCFLLLSELDKRRGKINFFILYIARYIRLTPAYLIVIGFYCSYLFRIGSGPLWDSRIQKERDRCMESWWTNILYINNYVNTDHMCMFQSWFLAVDFHLFIIAPFIIYPLWKWPKLGKILLGVGTAASIFTPFIITFKRKLDPTLMVFAPEVYDITENFYFKTAYIKTHMRAGSYSFGLLFGYILYKMQTKGIKISKYVLWFGWLLSSVCGVVALYSVVIFYDPYHEYNVYEASFYASMHRVAWCIFIGWIIIVCVTKNSNLVNRFLSWKPFIPLSRLTYCAYLTNGFVEVYTSSTIRHPMDASKIEFGSRVIAHFILTFFVAFFLCIFFESPIHGLEKVLLHRAPRRDEQKTNNEQECNVTS